MMTQSELWVTRHDYARLRRLLSELERGARGTQPGPEALKETLDVAQVIEPGKVRPNVVTMNSKVGYEDISSGKKSIVSVVFPSDADAPSGRISVLSPVGMALLGSSEGDEMDLPLPHGQSRRIRIVSVLYQPEAEGEFAL